MTCSKAAPPSLLSFAEIIHGRDSSVRYTHDNYIYAVDLVMVVTALERNQAGLSLRRVIEKKLLSIQMIERNTGGKGNGRTQLITLHDALQLIMVLPGEMAKAIRLQIATILIKYFGGDEGLIDQIRANAASNSPVCQMARASLAAEQEDVQVIGRKREREDRLLELEVAEREMELEERKLVMEERRLAYKSKLLDHANKAMLAINELKDFPNVDERTKLQAEDYIKNVLFNSTPNNNPGPSSLAIANGGDQPNQTDAISVSIVAREIGVKLTDAQLIGVGRKMAHKYRETYDKEPTKHKQFVNGQMMLVNSYMERDRAMMEQIIREVSAN